LTPDQLQRLAIIRPLKIPDKQMHKLMAPHFSEKQTFSKLMTIVTHGATKVYLSQLIRTAKQVQEEWAQGNDASLGPLRPDHLCEAQRRLALENSDSFPHVNPPPALFQ
jgi:hypothetical protein